MSDFHLSKEDCEIILQNYLKDSSVKYLNSETTLLTGDVKGFIGIYLKLNIAYESEKKRCNDEFFVKMITNENGIRSLVTETAFKKELFFYEFLLNEYKKYNFDISFAPKCYYSKNNILVLENLTLQNLVLVERRKLFDIFELKSALKSIAKFHAASFMYEEKISKNLGRPVRLDAEYPDIFKENYFSHLNGSQFGKTLIQSCLDRITFMINHLKCDQHYKDDFISRLQLDHLLSCFTDGNVPFRKTCGHGDLWFNNMFFGYDTNNKANKCCIIDFQVLRYFYPAYDVLFFIYLNTNRSFRNKYIDELLQFYYSDLSETVRIHGYFIEDILPKKEFEDSIDFVKRAVLFNSSITSSFIHVPLKEVNEHYKNTEDAESQFGLKVFNNIICNLFLNDEWYRNIISEYLYELHDNII